MCTLTYLYKSDNNFLLTSNRDERHTRKQAALPQIETLNGIKILYPKDLDAGGTWIGISEKGRTICLLNGAFVRHERKPTYRMSRGLVVLDALQANAMEDFFAHYSLEAIEPFTMIWIEKTPNIRICEMRWDESEKHILHLNPQAAYIWSSTTIYPLEVAAMRQDWFQHWQNQHPHYERKDIVDFHFHGGNGNLRQNLRMKDDYGQTVSITSIESFDDHIMMEHHALLYEKQASASIALL